MGTISDEKKKGLIALFGLEGAAETLAKAAAIERAADERGLKYKERRENLPFAGAPSYNPPAGTGIGDFLRGK